MHPGRTSLGITPLWVPRSLFCTCEVWEVAWLPSGTRNVWSVQGPASSLNCFSPQEMTLQWIYPHSPRAGGGGHLPSVSGPFPETGAWIRNLGDPGSNPCPIKFCSVMWAPLCQDQHTLQACREIQNNLSRHLEQSVWASPNPSSHSLPHGRLIDQERRHWGKE